jgi:hypothetical protein
MKQKHIQFIIADSIGLQVVANIIIEQSSYTRISIFRKCAQHIIVPIFLF